MATLQQLGEALKNAHNAGDFEAASLLAAEINKQIGRVPPAAPAEPEPIDRTLMGQAGELFRGVPRGIVSLLETAGVGASALLPEGPEEAVRAFVERTATGAAAPFQPKPGYEDSLAGTVGEALGSTLPFFGTAAIPSAAARIATGLGLGSAAGAGEARTRAEAAGATEEERARATVLGVLPGAAEMAAPTAIVGRFLRLRNAVGPDVATSAIARLQRVALAAGEEGAQEAASEIAQNLIARGVYDPEQGVFTNTGESFGLGAGVGGLVAGLMELAIPGRARGVEQPPAVEPPAAEQPTVVEEPTAEQLEEPTVVEGTRLSEEDMTQQAVAPDVTRQLGVVSPTQFVGEEEIIGAAPVTRESVEIEGETGPAYGEFAPRFTPISAAAEQESTITPEYIGSLGVDYRARSWVNENLIGKTAAQVQQMVEANPSLVTQPGKRSELLRAILATPPSPTTTFTGTPATPETAPGVATVFEPVEATPETAPSVAVDERARQGVPVTPETAPGVAVDERARQGVPVTPETAQGVAATSVVEEAAPIAQEAAPAAEPEVVQPLRSAAQPKREEAANIPVNRRIMDTVRSGATSSQILQNITQDREVPKPLRDLARSMLRTAPNINVPVVERRYGEADVVGQYIHPQQGTEAIYLDPRAESVAQTFLHEFVHPMTVNAIARKTPEGMRLVTLFEQYKAQNPQSKAYGFDNAYEFVAEANTNPAFQSVLKKQGWWGRLVDAVRRIMGLPAAQSGTLEEIMDLTKRLGVKESDARVQIAATKLVSDPSIEANTEFLSVQGQQLKRASTPVRASAYKRAVAFMFDKGQAAVTKSMTFGLGLDQLNDYVQSYIKPKGDDYAPFAASFDRFAKIAGKQEGELQEFVDSITAQISRMGDWRFKNPDLYEDMNDLVYGGTIAKVDLTKPRSTYEKSGSINFTAPASKYRNAPAEVKQAYEDGVQRLREYDRLKKIYDKLGPSGGQAIYRQMRAIYNRVFDGIKQQVYDRVYSETQDAELATTIKNKFTEHMKLRGLEGYAALTRNSGKYRLVYALPGSDQQYFEIFDNSADWELRQQQLVEQDGVQRNSIKPFLHGETDVFDGIVPTSFMGDLVQTLKEKGASKELFAAVMELGISAAPASVVMERLAKRKETPGYTVDAFSAFQDSVVGLQRKLINMKYGAQLSKEVSDMRGTRNNVRLDPTVLQFIDEATARAAYAANPNQNQLSNLLTVGTYGWTLGLNVSSAVVDMISLVVTGASLSSRFGFRKAHKAMVKAGADILSMGTTADVETMVTQGLEGEALQEALNTAGINERDVVRRRVVPSMLNIDFNNPEQAKKWGYLRALVAKVRDQGHSERFSDLDERAEFGESNLVSKLSARMGFMMSASERYKRETGLKAFYDLELAKVAPNGDPNRATPEQMEAAANEAMKMSRLLNGGSSPVTGPAFQRDNFWRVAFMYRSFAFRQMYVQLKTLYDATRNDDPAVRRAARKFGGTVLLTSGAVVGVQGMPLFGPAALLINLIAQPFVEDEEEEEWLQNMLRSNLDPLLYEGLPNILLNMNVSERASLTDLLARDTNLPSDATLAETVAAHFGGPAFGSLERAWRGKDLIEQGQIMRGVENMVPVALSNILKSMRFATEGAAETLRGDEVVDISPAAVASQLLGFTPADYARTMQLKSAQAGIDRRIGERKANLYSAAYAAYRLGDSAGLAEVMRKIIEFNRLYPAEAITTETLRQSLRTRARNSNSMLGGTLPRESRRAEWLQAAEDWGVEFPE